MKVIKKYVSACYQSVNAAFDTESEAVAHAGNQEGAHIFALEFDSNTGKQLNGSAAWMAMEDFSDDTHPIKEGEIHYKGAGGHVTILS